MHQVWLLRLFFKRFFDLFPFLSENTNIRFMFLKRRLAEYYINICQVLGYSFLYFPGKISIHYLETSKMDSTREIIIAIGLILCSCFVFSIGARIAEES